MKLATSVILCLFITLNGISQFTRGFKYQALINDKNGLSLPTDRGVSLRISLLKEYGGGESVYSEIHKVLPNSYSVVEITVGKGEVVSGVFNEVKWDEADHYLQVEVDLKGGTDFQNMGVSQLFAVPYALYAVESGKAEVGNADPNDEIQDLELIDNKILRINKNFNATNIDLSKVTNIELFDLIQKKANQSENYNKTQVDSIIINNNKSQEERSRTEFDEKLKQKTDINSIYLKSEIDGLLNQKPDTSKVYTRFEIDKNSSGFRADIDKNRMDIDNLISIKSEISEVYSKAELNVYLFNEDTLVNKLRIEPLEIDDIKNLNAELLNLKEDKIYRTEIVDELTVQESLRPLSAKQGYVLNNKISENKALINNNTGNIRNEISNMLDTLSSKSITYNKTEVDSRINTLNSNIPKNSVYRVSDLSELPIATSVKGDFLIVESENKTYVNNGGSSGNIDDWSFLAESVKKFECPAGYLEVKSNGNTFGCIQNNVSTTSVNYLTAMQNCFDQGGRLPSFNDLYIAFNNYSLTGENSHFEWTNQIFYDSNTSAYYVVVLKSIQMNNSISSSTNRYRCWIDK